jgi:cytochrome c oxidase cbb3-type subunit III
MRPLHRALPVAAIAAVLLQACAPAPPAGAASRSSADLPAVGPVPGPPRTDTGAANPYANDRTAIGEGRQLFVRFNCSGCHGGRGGGGMGPSLRDQDWIYGSSDVQIFSSIAQGRAHGMPTWQHHLTNDQIWKLVAYIKSMGTRNESQPPPSQ